jgi:magnesium dechelatase
MKRLKPEKLNVFDAAGDMVEKANIPRRYTLTHSDMTGDLFLVIAREYDRKAIAGLYTRIMRDEVLAELTDEGGSIELRIYCHVSGGYDTI